MFAVRQILKEIEKKRRRGRRRRRRIKRRKRREDEEEERLCLTIFWVNNMVERPFPLICISWAK